MDFTNILNQLDPAGAKARGLPYRGHSYKEWMIDMKDSVLATTHVKVHDAVPTFWATAGLLFDTLNREGDDVFPGDSFRALSCMDWLCNLLYVLCMQQQPRQEDKSVNDAMHKEYMQWTGHRQKVFDAAVEEAKYVRPIPKHP